MEGNRRSCNEDKKMTSEKYCKAEHRMGRKGGRNKWGRGEEVIT